MHETELTSVLARHHVLSLLALFYRVLDTILSYIFLVLPLFAYILSIRRIRSSSPAPLQYRF